MNKGTKTDKGQWDRQTEDIKTGVQKANKANDNINYKTVITPVFTDACEI